MTAPAGLAPVAVTMLGVAEHPVMAESPYRVGAEGRPYVPVGDGGIVLGLALGDPVTGHHGDHAAPGACLIHPDPAARCALTTYACIGNEVLVRTGRAAGARGAVIGKRGEAGRVIAAFRPADLARLRPGDQAAVRACGQGFRPAGWPAGVTVMNLSPALARSLPLLVSGDRVTAGVRRVLPGVAAGNGIGRPAVAWDLDLDLSPDADGAVSGLRLGDLVAVSDLDARHTMGYRRGWVTVGVVAHGASPLPGHGPGITVILTGPRPLITAREDGGGHTGLTLAALGLS